MIVALALVLVVGLVVWGAAQARGPHRTTGGARRDEAGGTPGLAS